MSTERDHYVYDAYDADGVCLYVGCTGDPAGRYKTHMSGNADARGWFDPYVVRWRVSGPYPKPVAYGIERTRTEELEPVFNGLTPANRGGRRNAIKAYIALHEGPGHLATTLPAALTAQINRRNRQGVPA